MVEKYAIGSQAAGFISLNGEVLDTSTYSPTDHVVNIPAGMINIGGQGKGYTIPATIVFRFTPQLTPGTYVIYANAPTDSSGIVTLASDSFANYIASGGDNLNRRAFCYFKVQAGSTSDVLVQSSIVTFQSRQEGIPLDPNVASTGHFTSEVFDKLKKMGFFLNTSTDVGFTYRGQFWAEDATFDASVSDWDIVYKNIDGSYYPAVANDTLSERAIGIAERDRNGEDSGDNYVITSGIVTVGTGILPTADYPPGTYIYLTDDVSSPGSVVRDFDFWTANTSYAAGDRIIGDTNLASGAANDEYAIFEALGAGLSDGVTEPDWSTAASTGGTVVDNAVTWENVGAHVPNFLNTNRKIRVGISLGNGVMLLQPSAVAGATSIDDHDEGAFAHLDVQTAMAKAGIYVIKNAEGRNFRNNFAYRGQGFDEQAALAGGIVDTDLVYRNSAGNYQKAIADDTVRQNVIGMALDVSGNTGTVVTSGFVTANTTGMTVGDKIYLTETVGNEGQFTNAETPLEVGFVMVVGGSTAGLIVLKTAGGGTGIGDITSEDQIYRELLNSSFMTKAYYDPFTDVNSPVALGVDSVATEPTYSGSDSSYLGVPEDSLETDAVVRPSGILPVGNTTTYYKFFVHGEATDLIFNEVSSVVVNDDTSGSPLAGTYFILYSANDATQYHAWYNSGADSDPDPVPGISLPIEVVYSALDTSDVIASLTAAAIDAVSDFEASVSSSGAAEVNISNQANGKTTDIVDSDTGFAFTTVKSGGAISYSVDGGGVAGTFIGTFLNQVIFIPAGFTTLHIRFSWISTGKLLSYGVLFGENTDDILNQTNPKYFSFNKIIGTELQVINNQATHTIDNFNGSDLTAGDKLLFLDGTHSITQNEDITLNDIKMYFSPEAILDDGSNRTLTLSGDRIQIYDGRFTGFSANDIVVSGDSAMLTVTVGALTNFQIDSGSSGSVVISSDATDGGIKNSIGSVTFS